METGWEPERFGFLVGLFRQISEQSKQDSSTVSHPSQIRLFSSLSLLIKLVLKRHITSQMQVKYGVLVNLVQKNSVFPIAAASLFKVSFWYVKVNLEEIS